MALYVFQEGSSVDENEEYYDRTGRLPCALSGHLARNIAKFYLQWNVDGCDGLGTEKSFRIRFA